MHMLTRLILPAALVMPLGQAAVADQGTAKILAPWEANGQLFQVAIDKLQFIGTFEGIMYIEQGEGLLDAALFTCPSTQIIHVLSNQLEGHGFCTIESPTGDYIYAEFTCNGEPGSCRGTFTLTGGTGRLAGITGESNIIVRTALSGTAINEASGGTVSAAKGLAIWPEMRFEFPGKSAKSGMLGTGPANNGIASETDAAIQSLGQTANGTEATSEDEAASEAASSAEPTEGEAATTNGNGASHQDTQATTPSGRGQ